MNFLNKRIWVEDQDHVYLPGLVVGKDKNQLKVEVWINSKKLIVLIEEDEEIAEVKESFNPDDLFVLREITQQYLLDVLRRRFNMNNSITLIGKSLAIWVNKASPSKLFSENDTTLIREFCQSIVREEIKKKYVGSSPQASSNINEAIVLFGQTNSGKTALSNALVETLLEMSSTFSDQSLFNKKEIIVQTLQVIKLFNQCGRASKSCFSINLNYDMTKEIIVSCKVVPFILICNNLTSNGQETNFNFFYMMIDTMNDKDKAVFLYKPSSYFLSLAKPNETEAPMTLDQFKAFLKILSLHEENIHALISILMAILYFGNVQFMIDPSNKEVDIHPNTKEDMKAISSLLSIEYNELKKIYIECQSVVEASLLRNKIIFHLYTKINDWLINQINHFFNEKEKEYSSQSRYYSEKKKTVSIFDSIGHQSTSFNSLDDFIINYSNERIIELFTKKLLSQEQDEYRRESIQWKDVDYFDNSEVLNLFDNKGLIDLLDDLSSERLSVAKDENKDKLFYNKVYQSYSNNNALGIKCDDFITINHSFGDNHYYIDGFINKNIKVLPKDVNSCLESSKNTFINQMINYNKINNTETLVKHYKKRIDEFITILSHSNLRFIRCFNVGISSNPTSEFNSSMIYSQLLPSNIVQIFSFMKKQFSIKMTYQTFIRKYAFLSNDILLLIKNCPNCFDDNQLRNSIQKAAVNLKGVISDMLDLLRKNKHLKKSLSNVQIGLIMIYLDDAALARLDNTIKDIHNIKTLQRNFRGLLQKKSKIKVIQKAFRTFLKRKRMKIINESRQKELTSSKAKALSAQKANRKSVLQILKKEQNNLVESEFLLMIKTLQDEIALLRDVQSENELLKRKNTTLQVQLASIETEKQKRKDSDSQIAPRNSTSKSALALLTEISTLKKKLKDYEIKIETQSITIQQNEHTISDLKKLNGTLQEQISKRSQGDFNELNQLMEKIAIMEKEKKDYEYKLTNYNTDNSASNFAIFSRESIDKESSKNMSEYKKIILGLKSELKQSKGIYNELKANYSVEVNKAQALSKQLQSYQHKNEFSKDIMIVSEHKMTIRRTIKQQTESEKRDEEMSQLKEQLSNCIEKNKRKEEAYQEQLILKSKELKERYDYIATLQNSLDMQMDNSIQRRKEIFKMKNKEINLSQSDYNSIIKKKDEELKQIKEIADIKQKLYQESTSALKRKKRIIQKKKEENSLLVELFKNKKSELQCIEALKYANSTSIKEKLLKVQDQEKDLISRVEEIANDSDYTDENEDENEDNSGKGDSVVIKEGEVSFGNGSIESYQSNDEERASNNE